MSELRQVLSRIEWVLDRSPVWIVALTHDPTIAATAYHYYGA